MHYIGKIDKSKIGLYSEKIKTEMVVLTDERKQHIYQSHPKDYKKIIGNIIWKRYNIKVKKYNMK